MSVTLGIAAVHGLPSLLEGFRDDSRHSASEYYTMFRFDVCFQVHDRLED